VYHDAYAGMETEQRTGVPVVVVSVLGWHVRLVVDQSYLSMRNSIEIRDSRIVVEDIGSKTSQQVKPVGLGYPCMK
jgi:hypothetical protein